HANIIVTVDVASVGSLVPMELGTRKSPVGAGYIVSANGVEVALTGIERRIHGTAGIEDEAGLPPLDQPCEPSRRVAHQELIRADRKLDRCIGAKRMRIEPLNTEVEVAVERVHVTAALQTERLCPHIRRGRADALHWPCGHLHLERIVAGTARVG